MKFATDRRNTANDVGIIDWCTVPSVADSDASRNKNIISAAIFGSNGYTLVKKAMKMLYRKDLVITFYEDVVI